jgi:hypothetical protein
MNLQTWFILDRGKVAGPFSLEQIASQCAQGTFSPFAKVSEDRAQWVPFDQQLAEVRARENAPMPIRPPARAGIPSSGDGKFRGTPAQREYRTRLSEVLQPFPVVALILLHYLTLSIYTFFWITRVHGLLPRMKTDDPGATKAISLCFVPCFNIYWIVFVYARLARRLNALSGAYQLPRSVPVPIAYVMSFLIVLPLAMFTAGGALLVIEAFSDAPVADILLLFFQIPLWVVEFDLVLVVPVFAALLQRSVNRIAYAQLELLLQNQA